VLHMQVDCKFDPGITALKYRKNTHNNRVSLL
jgi:hypothetical protein